MMAIKLILNNNKTKIICSSKRLNKVRDEFKIRAQNYFWSSAYRSGRWDGYIQYITESGYIWTGLIPELIKYLHAEKLNVEIHDERENIEHSKITNTISNFKLREYQKNSVKSIVLNDISGVHFPRGIIDEATNAGKNLISAAIFKSYNNINAIFLIDNKLIFEQALKEMAEILPGQIGYLSSKNEEWNNFMICMAPTVKNRLSKLKSKLAKFNMVIVDEAHRSYNPTYTQILNNLYNCYIRIAMSGTAQLNKDKNANKRIQAFFGPVVHKTTNKDLIDWGYSTKPVIKIIKGNTLVRADGDREWEYTAGISTSRERNKKIWARVKYNIKKNRLPILIIVRHHEHIKKLMRLAPKFIKENFSIDWMHHKRENREEILDFFKQGKLHILISSMIIKEGQNIPLIKVLINASATNSAIEVIQLIGRALRKHSTKDKVYIEDFWDEGIYLKRYSKHRLKLYQEQKFLIKQLYLNT